MSKKFAIIYILSIIALFVACASIGTPDGGPYDEEPPLFLVGTPAPNALHVADKKVVLNFDEYIKLQNAFEKVVISPPQKEMPEIKSSGKRITIQLNDSLIPNTTYSIDFNDAIVDNNEGNPLENFSYVFSTGNTVDTLGVSGTVLNAQDLEPIKGMLVGLYTAGDDSAFYKKSFERVSRTDSRGRFNIKGVAPGKYRIYALSDANNNFLFDQKSEKIAFSEQVIEPFATRAERADTIWRDSLTIDSIRFVPYTRLQPDDIVLRAFNEDFYMQSLLKYPRKEHSNFTLYFTAPNEKLPQIKGLNFDATDAFVLAANSRKDTLQYWIKDSAIYHMDTLAVSVTYDVLDTLGLFVPRCDTVLLTPRKSRARVLADEKEAFEKAEKEFLKKARKRKDYDEDNPPVYIPPTKELKIKSLNSSTMDVNANYVIEFAEPLLSIDTMAIHLARIVNDSTQVDMPFVFRQDENNIRRYVVYAEWRPEEQYEVKIDSATFHGLYGGTSFPFSEKVKFRSLDDYSVLHLNIPGTGNNAVVELLAAGGNPVASQRTENNRCSFYFIKPGKYYLRLLMDDNGNGVWDTGDYSKGLQPERVYYYPNMLELRALFEYSQDDWDINAPLEKQKSLEITKQKPDKERVKRNRNAERKFQ